MKKIAEYHQSLAYKEKQRQSHLGEKNYWFGRHHSQETKDKISEANKGKPNPNKGKHLSEEWRKKISESMKGQTPWCEGKEFSEEHRKHLSESHMGQTSWMKGKHHSEETKEKISKSQIERFKDPKEREKISETMKGRSHECSEETKMKIGKANKGKIRSEEFKEKMKIIGRNREFSESTRLRMSLRMKEWMSTEEGLRKVLCRRIPTSLEEKFQEIVDKNSLPYRYVGDGSFVIGRYNPDFINTNNEKIAIEVYAKYYKLRNNETIDEWKRKRSKVFESYGWKVIFLDETEVNNKFILMKLKQEER